MIVRILVASLLIAFSSFSFGYADTTKKLFHKIINNEADDAKQILNNNPGLLNAVDKTGRTPLRWASHKKNTELVDWLIKKGAKIDIIYASEIGDLKKVQELINSDKQLVNYKDKIGKTPLHWATLYGHIDIVRYLVTKGANVNSKDIKQSSVLHHAISSLGPDDKSEILNILIDNGVELNPRDNVGRTPLYRAVLLPTTEGALNKIMILLKNGSDMYISSNDSRTPLCQAILYNRTSFIKLLIDHGVDVNQGCYYGDTPLHIAIEGYFSGNDSWDDNIIKLLISAGADISIKVCFR